MFDVGFSELLVIAVVALIVVGPERLPRVARTAGALLGRLQRYVGEVKAEVSREIHLEEMRRLQQDVSTETRALEEQVATELGDAAAELGKAESAMKQAVAESDSNIAPAIDRKEQA